MLTIFTTITDPERRGDHWHESIQNYCELADQVVVVDGSEVPHSFDDPKIKVVHQIWPKEFHWLDISRAFQRGYDEADGDWVIHMDLDWLFHERDFETIKQTLHYRRHEPALSFWKFQFILPDRYQLKSRLVLAVNKKEYGDRIKFDGGGEQDLCQPSLDGKYLSPGDVEEARIPFYNYEKMTKTKAQIAEDSGRMDRAYYKQFGRYQLSQDGTDEQAFNGYMHMVTGRFNKPQKEIDLDSHPQVIQDTIKNLTSDQLGYSLFGERKNNYV